MLLTCSNCQKSFFIDDQAYAAQGGALCEQCQIPLTPVQNGGYEQWQQNADAQWGQQDAQWGQQPMDAQWGQQDAQWNQQPGNGQWNQQPGNGQWNQQPGNGQWNQQNAQWGQQDAQWGQQEAQWGQQPPMDAQWGQQPPMDAQWGQQPQGGSQWGSQEQWAQMADKPMETVALIDAVEPPVMHDDNGERTVAIGAYDEGCDASDGSDNGMDDWKKAEEMPTSVPSAVYAKSNAKGIVVGKPMDPTANENMTRQIDVKALHKLYGDKSNPVKDFFTSIPMRFHIICGSVVVVALIALIIGYAVINSTDDEKIFDKNGDLITDDSVVESRSFDEIAMAMKDLSPSFFPLDGTNLTSGSIVAVASDIGIVYDEKKIADYSVVERGPRFIQSLYDEASKDADKLGDSIVFLYDETLTMSVVYRTLYSFGASSRPVLIGGTTRNGVTSVNVMPCAWPDHELTTFGECKNVSIELKVTKIEMFMHRVVGEEPLAIDPDGKEYLELRDDIIGGKVNFQSIKPALARLRSAANSSVKIVPDGDVSFGVFMNIVQQLRGSADTPVVRQMYLAPVSLR